jgi:hypothetical protein
MTGENFEVLPWIAGNDTLGAERARLFRAVNRIQASPDSAVIAKGEYDEH